MQGSHSAQSRNGFEPGCRTSRLTGTYHTPVFSFLFFSFVSFVFFVFSFLVFPVRSIFFLFFFSRILSGSLMFIVFFVSGATAGSGFGIAWADLLCFRYALLSLSAGCLWFLTVEHSVIS